MQNKLHFRTRWLQTAVCTLILLFSLNIGNAWGAPYFTDNFSNVGDNTSDMSSRDGWESATRVYNHYNSAIRLASGSNTGTITKTAMTGIGASPTAIVLRFAAKSWNTDGSELNIVVNNAGTANNTNFILRKETSTSSSFSFTDEDYFEVIISNATSSTTITFNAASGKRVFLGDVSIYPYESEGKYVLVEDDGDIETGDYLIVYNNTNALNKRNSGNWDTNQYGSYTSISSYYTSSTKSIASNTTTDGLAYHVKATTNGYYIRKKSSGGFLGYASSSTNTGNYLQWNRELTANQNEWTLGVNSIVSVKNTSCAIRYNSGFKIYGPANQSAVQLFKKVTCTGINPSVTYTSTTLYKGDVTSAPTITGNTGSAGITWTSSNTDVATVSSTGVVTALKAGTTTIKASFAAAGDYCAKDVSINFTIRYRVKWSVNGDDSYETGSPSLYVEAHNGKIGTFPTSPASAACDGSKEFVGWTATPIVGTTNAKPTFVTPQTQITDNTTLYAVFATRTANSYSPGDINDLINGKNVIIYNANQSKAMASSIQATGKLNGLAVTFSSTDISSPDAALIWTVYNSGTKYIFKNSSGNYLRVTSSSSNTNLTCDGTSDTWTITEVSTGLYSLYSTAGSSTYPLEAYYSSPNYFFTSYKGSGANYNMTFYVPTYSAYVTTCCTPPGTALSITGSTTVAMDGTLSLGTSGGNGNTVSWSVATLSGGNGTINSSGVLTPSAVGTVTVTASQAANSYCAQEATLTVTITLATVNVTGVSVSPTTKAIVPGETFTITPTVAPAGATDKTVSWSSNATSKATVNSSGVVTGVAAGSATITCTTTDGGYTATCAVTVYGVTVSVEDEDGTPLTGVGKPTISRSGAAVTTAAAGNYTFKEWSVLNATLSGSTSTGTTITSPTGAVTVKAIYYKPITVTYWNNGVNVHEDLVERGSNVSPTYSGVTSGGSGDNGPCDATHVYFVGWSHSQINGSTNTEPADIGTAYNSVTSDVNFYAVWTDVDAEDYSSDYTAGTSGDYAPVGCNTGCTVSVGDITGIPAVKIGRGCSNNPSSFNILLPSGTTQLSFRARYWDSGASMSLEFFDAGPTINSSTSASCSPTLTGTNMSGNNTSFGLTAGEDLFTYTIANVNSDTYITLTASCGNRVIIYDINTSSGGGGGGGGGGGSGDAEYITTCCSELGTIGGTVSSYTQTSVTLEWNKLSNVDGTTPYTVTASGGSVGSIDLSGAKATCTITGLSCNTAYTFGITAHGTTGYCDKTQSGIAQTTSSYSVSYTITNGSKTSGETSTCGPLTAVFSANSGYHLPDKAAITVTGASDFSWTKATGTLTITAGQITGNISISFTCPADACSGVNSLHTGTKSGGDWLYNKCFSDVDWGAADDAIWVGEFPSTNECYVGWAGGDSYYGAYWAVGGIKTYDIPNGRTLGWNSSDYYSDYPATAIGTFHIYKNSTDENYYLRFKPTTYVLRTGSDGTSWTSRDMTVSGVNANYYESEFVTLTSTMISENAYVDLKANNANGHVWCNFSNSRTASGNVKVKNGASTFRATDLQAADNGSYGKFQIDITQDVDNWKLAFVPYYRITYNANGGTGSTAASSFVEVGSTAAAASNGFTAPTGKQFGGWATTSAHAAAGTVDYAAGASVTLNGDVELFAVWTDVNYTVTINQSPDVSATTTGQTSSAHYNGTINLTTTVPDGYRFVNWTTSDGFSITNNTSATTASFTMPAKNVTVTANFEHVYTVNWNVGGVNTGWALAGGGTFSAQSPYNSGAALVVPGNPAVPVACGEKSFVGWTSDGAILSETSTAPSFLNTESPGTVTADVTYYAVFADGSSSTTYKWVRQEVTSGFGLSDLSEGTWALVTAAGYVFNGTMSSGHGQKTESAASFTNDEVASLPDGACQLTFTQVKENENVVGYTVYNSTYGYLYATKAGSGGLAWHNSESSYWKIASNNFIYNSNSAYLRVYDNTFRTYASASNASLYLAKYTSVTVPSYDNYITTCSSCTTPSSLSVGSITSTGGTVSWSGVSIDDGFTVLWGTDATRANNNNSAHVASGTNEYEITGLTPATRYYVWVQSECDDSWSSSTNFYTNAKITYAAGTGASGTMAPKEVTYNTNVTVDACTFTAPSGKKFNGWVSNTSVTVGGSSTTSVADGATISNLTAAITLTAQWRDLASYTINFSANNGTVVGGTSTTVYEDGKLTFPNVTSTTCGTFIGWIESSSYDNATKPSGDTFHEAGDQIDVVPALDNKTYYAVYAEVTDPTPTNDYVKVECEQTDWEGDYLIVTEYTKDAVAYTRAFDGSLETLTSTSNYQAVSISSKTITADNTINGYKFTVSAVDGQAGKFYIKSASNYYIGYGGNSNDMSQSASTSTTYYNTIEYDATNSRILIKGSHATTPSRLAFNSNSGQDRFRYYSSPDSQKDIQLYKKGGAETVNYNTSPSCSPTVALTYSFSTFTYVYNAGPSASQTFMVSGSNLGANTMTVTAPTNYEVSKDNSTFSSSVSYTPLEGSVAASTVYIRLAAGLSVGTYNYAQASGLVVACAGAGATAQKAALNGTVAQATGSIAFTDFNAVDHYEAEWTGSAILVPYNYIKTGDGTLTTEKVNGRGGAVDTENKKWSLTNEGTYTLRLTLGNGTNYTGAGPVTADFVIYKADRFYDNLHGNDMILKRNDVGEDHYTIPSLTDESRLTSGTCSETHYHFMGWVPESALSSLPDDAAYTAVMITGGGTQSASGTNYYAVWAEE